MLYAILIFVAVGIGLLRAIAIGVETKKGYRVGNLIVVPGDSYRIRLSYYEAELAELGDRINSIIRSARPDLRVSDYTVHLELRRARSQVSPVSHLVANIAIMGRRFVMEKSVTIPRLDFPSIFPEIEKGTESLLTGSGQ